MMSPTPATPAARGTWLPLPRLLLCLRACVGCIVLCLSTGSHAQKLGCSLQSASSAANPFTVSAQLQPTSGLARIQGNLKVSCQFSGSLSWTNTLTLDTGASNSRGGLLERRAQLVTNAAIEMPYALTRYGLCAGAATSSDWFDLGTAYIDSEEGSMTTASQTFYLPFCVTAGMPNNGNLSLRAGTYRDNVRFTMNYGLFNSGRGYSGTTTLDMVIEIQMVAGCIVSTSPGNLSLSYPAFSSITREATTQVGVTCSPGLPWEATVSNPSGVVSNIELPYTVNLNTSQGTGSGAQQLIDIAVRLPPNVSGRCASRQCTETLPVTAVIGY